MHFKLIVAFVNEKMTSKILDASRSAGATGATVINNAHGEGIVKNKSFFGLSVENDFDILLFLVEEHLSLNVLEKINLIGKFDALPGTGIAFQVDTEDAVGICHQIKELNGIVEERI